MDISNILRGKIEILDQFLDMKNIFDRIDKMEKEVEEAKKKLQQGA